MFTADCWIPTYNKEREHMGKKVYACFGGFSDQFWTRLKTPDFRGNCDGLTICELDMESGRLHLISQDHGIDSPSTLVVSPDQNYIYVTNESHDFKEPGLGGGITAFAFDKEKKEVTKINDTFSLGGSACYVSLDKTGQYLFVANGGSKFYVTQVIWENGTPKPVCVREKGSVCVFRIRKDGGIGELADRIVLEGTGIDKVEHASAHPHSILIDDEDFVIIPNKGGDNIYVAKFNRETEKLKVLSVFQSEFGSSPRHAAFVKGTPYVLVQNEYDGHINSYELNRKNGVLKRISRLDTIIAGFSAKENDLLGNLHPWGLDVQVHPNGKFVYTNNTQTSINTFWIDENGRLSLKFQYHLDIDGMTRGMQIDREGKYLMLLQSGQKRRRNCPIILWKKPAAFRRNWYLKRL